jgi:hypothetical protein
MRLFKITNAILLISTMMLGAVVNEDATAKAGQSAQTATKVAKANPAGAKPVQPTAAADCPNGCDQIMERPRALAKPASEVPAPAANWEDPKGGQHMDKGRPALAKPAGDQTGTPAAAGDPCNRPGVQCDPRDAQPPAGKQGPKGAGGSGQTLGLVAGISAAIITGIVLASGGNDRPTSP